MTTSQDDFSPMSIDQAIDRPDESLSHKDAQLIHDMRAMFEQEKQASIERGWARIASQHAQNAHNDQSLDLSLYRQRNERISLVQDNTLLSSPKKDTPKKRSGLRWLGLVAAVLVCVALVASLAVVLGATRGQKPNTQVGGHNAAQQPTPTPTPLVVPVACKDALNSAEQTLCAEGKETTLNITKSVTVHTHDQNGKTTGTATLNITFLRAYADTSHLLLVYTINQAPAQTLGNDWGGYGTLSTAQGDLRSSSPCMAQGLCVESFDTGSLPAGTKQLQAQSLQTDFGDSLALTFTVPVQAATGTTVTVNQTVTGKGYAFTLDHLVLTESTTTLFYTYTVQSAGTHLSVQGQSITINGQSQESGTPSGGTGKGDKTGGSGTVVIDQSFLNQPGTWTVTLNLMNVNTGSAPKPLPSATFTFTVAA